MPRPHPLTNDQNYYFLFKVLAGAATLALLFSYLTRPTLIIAKTGALMLGASASATTALFLSQMILALLVTALVVAMISGSATFIYNNGPSWSRFGSPWYGPSSFGRAPNTHGHGFVRRDGGDGVRFHDHNRHAGSSVPAGAGATHHGHQAPQSAFHGHNTHASQSMFGGGAGTRQHHAAAANHHAAPSSGQAHAHGPS